jgi:hypothetical protein
MMKRRLILAAWISAIAGIATATASGAPQTTFSANVTEICVGALLFNGQHQIGTRAGAVAVSQDIRETGTRRLRLVAAIPQPASQAAAVREWLNIEHRLVAVYARNYLRIWDAIERANTPVELARLPQQVQRLIHEPDLLKHQASVYQVNLNVPDCTGGGS